MSRGYLLGPYARGDEPPDVVYTVAADGVAVQVASAAVKVSRVFVELTRTTSVKVPRSFAVVAVTVVT